MIETLIGLMFMAMLFAGCAIGGVWILSKANGGNNAVATTLREFMAVSRGEPMRSGVALAHQPPQFWGGTPSYTPGATHAVGGSPPASALPPPGKGMALVLLFLAVLYLLSPIDLIPDIIPGFCHLDDIGVMVLAVKNAMKAFA